MLHKKISIYNIKVWIMQIDIKIKDLLFIILININFIIQSNYPLKYMCVCVCVLNWNLRKINVLKINKKWIFNSIYFSKWVMKLGKGPERTSRTRISHLNPAFIGLDSFLLSILKNIENLLNCLARIGYSIYKRYFKYLLQLMFYVFYFI